MRTGKGRSWLEGQERDRAGVTRNLSGGNWPEQQQQGVGGAVLRGCVCVCVCVCVCTRSGPALCDPMNGNPPGSSVHGIFQARIMKEVAISFSRGSSQSKDQTSISCIGRQILYH